MLISLYIWFCWLTHFSLVYFRNQLEWTGPWNYLNYKVEGKTGEKCCLKLNQQFNINNIFKLLKLGLKIWNLNKKEHGHLVSNQMLKNVKFCNQKNWSLKKNRSSDCTNENVWYPQGHLVTWLYIYFVNNSYSLQYSTNIWIWTKTRKCWKCPPVQKWRTYLVLDVSSNWFK